MFPILTLLSEYPSYKTIGNAIGKSRNTVMPLFCHYLYSLLFSTICSPIINFGKGIEKQRQTQKNPLNTGFFPFVIIIP